MAEMSLTSQDRGSPPVSPTTPFTMSFSDIDANEFLREFEREQDSEDFMGTLPFFDSGFEFNNYMDESQAEDTSTANSIHQPQQNNGSLDSVELHDIPTALADSTNKPEVATQEVTSKGETTNVSSSSSPAALSPTSKPQELRVDTGFSNSIKSSDFDQPASNPEQPATLDGHSTKSNATLDPEIAKSVNNLFEEAGTINPAVIKLNGPTSFGENANQQGLQEGEAPIDLNISFDGLFDSVDWNANAADTAGWNVNDWGFEDEAPASLPLNFDTPSAQANLAHQPNAEPFFNAVDNDSFSAQANLAHQPNAKPFLNAVDNEASSAPGTSTEPNTHGLLPNINAQGEEQALAEHYQRSINQPLHQHRAPHTSQANIMNTTVARNVGINARGIAQQYYTLQQLMKSSQTVTIPSGTIAGSPKQQVIYSMRMPVQTTSNNYHQSPTQRQNTGMKTNAHLQNINGHAHIDHINGHTLQVGQTRSNGHSQQRSKSLPTSAGSSKDEAINLISPVAATFNDEHASFHALSGPEPSISRQPVDGSHTLSGQNSHGSPHSQRSPGSAHQRHLQQMTPRSQSNLRYMSVPAQSMGQSQVPTGAGHQMFSGQMKSSVARPSVEAYQQLGLVASNGGHHSYSQGHGSDEMAGRILSGRGDNFTGPRVNDLRAQSLSNDATASQHRLSHSPPPNLGNHRVLTQGVFQSPQQRQFSLLNQPHALALQHLAPLQLVPRTSVLPNSLGASFTNNSMKHETSSPESVSGAPTKIKQVPQHDSRRGSQGSNFHIPNIDLNSPQNVQRVQLLYEAMMDMSDPHDNNGMLKTWRGLMKEQAKIWQVCQNILALCYRLEYQGKPLQQTIKSQNTYPGLDNRVRHICQAFQNQKTMCKHLLEAPYIHQVVDDPILAANRVVNNRKVNKGKKKAIEAGREALKAATPHAAGDTGSDFGTYAQNDDEDDDAEGEDDDDYGRVGQDFVSSVSPSSGLGPLSRKRAASNDLTYRASTPQNKRTKRPSKYQLNPNGEMVEVNHDDTAVRMRRGSQGTPQQQPGRRLSVNPYQNAVADGYNYHGTHFNTDYNVLDGIYQGQDQLSGPGGLPSQHGINYGDFRGPRLGNGQQDRQ